MSVETSDPTDLSTPRCAPPKTSRTPTRPTERNLTKVLPPHDDGGNNENLSSRSESMPPCPDYSQVNDDPYGIEEACLERELPQPDDESIEEIALGTNPNTPEENSVNGNREAALQDALRKVADLEMKNAQYLRSLMTTRGIAHEAEDQVRQLKGNLSKAKTSIETLKGWLEERDTELEGLEKDKIFLGIQLEQCEAEYNDLRKLARDIWIRMSDLEVILAEEYGEMLDEEHDVQRYGDLRSRAMDRINIPRVYMDVLADLTSIIENEGKINGQDRIIDEVSDNEETIVKRYPLVDDRNAVVVWTKPPFPPIKLSDKCPGVEMSTASNPEQTPERDMQALPVPGGLESASGRASGLPDGMSSASSEEQDAQTTVTDTEKEPSTDVNGIDVTASPNETPIKQLKGSPNRATEQFIRRQPPEASDAEKVKEKAAQDQSHIVENQPEAPLPAVEKNTIHYPSSIDDLTTTIDRVSQLGIVGIILLRSALQASRRN